jgi:hypothetical protein
MTWLRIDDHFHDDHRVQEAGMAAIGAYLLVCSWAANNDTGGYVAPWVGQRLVPHWSRLGQSLVKVRLLVELADGGHQIVDWEKTNPPSKDDEEARTRWFAAQRSLRYREHKKNKRDEA